MRPIVRGDMPKDDNGNPKVFQKYQEARLELTTRLGQYCSYCEVFVPSALEVEHIQPKDGPYGRPDLKLTWDNFLLACKNCNATKGSKRVDNDLQEHYWPHRDNTFRAFQYQPGGIVSVNPDLTDSEKKRAQRTIKLTGLDKRPTLGAKASDWRWQNRRKTWDKAERALQNLRRCDTPQMREQIVDAATGFWSVWMTVFESDSDMRHRFIQRFQGTCTDCFDDQGRPVPRPSGSL